MSFLSVRNVVQLEPEQVDARQLRLFHDVVRFRRRPSYVTLDDKLFWYFQH